MKLAEYAELPMRAKYRWCGTNLPMVINYYDHEGDWNVDGFAEKQWLCKVCVKCDYQWALTKLGVPKQ